MKDDDDDCDLDPELFVADLLVDEGKAARDGADQQKTVKVIQEQGRAIREGSVIPDLTPSHYQPPTRPPIPRFPDVLEKRRTEERQTDDRPTKRRRLDQIEEETNQIVNSIERDGERALSHFELPDAHFLSALNGTLNETGPEVDLKQESPELARTWVTTGPATVDELELLPEAPAHFKPRSRTNLQSTGRRQDPGPEIRESSAIAQEDQQHQRNEDTDQGPDSVVDRFVRQQSGLNEQTPVTPHNAGSTTQVSGSQAVSMLNSMKSNSPLLRQSGSASANKFRKPVKNVYDYPESDIDDTQMSPRSRASRSRITPKLVPTPFSKNTPKSTDAINRRNSQLSSAVQESPTQQKRNHEDAMDVDGDKENQLPHPLDQQVPSHAKADDDDVEADADQPDEAISAQNHQSRQSFDTDRSSILGSDETWSLHEDGTKSRKKKFRKTRSQRNLTGSVSTPRSSSAASLAKATPDTGKPTQQKPKRKRTVPTRVSDVHSRSEISELDSPGMQLSETLRQSSPVTRPSKESSQNVSEAVSKSTRASEPERTAEQIKDVDMDDVERPPDSASDDEEEVSLMKTPKRPKTKSKASESTNTDERRCLSCWTKKSRCDNGDPKCNTCIKNKKTCQILNMTQDEAIAERERRQAEKSLKSSQKSTGKGKKRSNPESRVSEDVVSATDGEDDSDDQDSTKATGIAQSQGTTSKRRSDRTPSKPQTSEPPVPVSDEDDVSESESRQMPKSSQSTATKSKSQKKPVETPSKTFAPVQNTDTDSKMENSPNDFKAAPTSVDHPQTQKKPESENKKRVQIKTSPQDTHTSPTIDKKQDIKDKGSELSSTFDTTATVGRAAVVSPTVPKDVPPAQANKSTTRERSMESQITSTSKILPPGMTEEQYDALIGSRSNLTDEQRTEKKLQIRKMGKTRDPTPSLRHESSTQDLVERSKQDTSSIKSSQQPPPSSRSTSKNQSKPPPSTQPVRAPTSVNSSTPSSAPAKSKQNPPAAANTSAKTKLKLQPAANTSAKTKSPNPPFQPHSSTQHKPPLPSSFTAASTASPSLDKAKSIREVRAALASSRSGSGANTPQPVMTTAARIAQIRNSSNVGVSKKQIFSLSDDEEEDESGTEEEGTDEEGDQQMVNKTGAVKTVNGSGRGNVTVRRRTPSESGSATDSDVEDDSDED